MKRIGILMVLAAVTAIAGCGGNGEVLIFATQAQLEQCMREGVVGIVRLAATMQDIVRVIRGNPVPDIIVTRTSPAMDPTPSYDVSATFPYAGAGANDQTVEGTMDFSADPEFGIDIGDTIVVNMDITSQGGPWTGYVSVRIRVASQTGSEFDGTLQIIDANSGCQILFSLDGLDPLVVDGLEFYSQIVANFVGIDMMGPVDFLLELKDTFLDASMILLGGSQVVTVTGTEDGEPFEPVDVDLFPDEAEVQALVDCGENAEATLFVLDAIVKAVQEAEGTDDPDTTVTLVVGSTYTFTVDNAGDIVSGTLTLTGAGMADVTWDLDATGITGESTSVWKVTIPEMGLSEAYGAATFTPNEPAGCTLTIFVAAGDPLAFDGEGAVDSGTVTITSMIGDDELQIVLAIANGNDEQTARINGIPVPADVLFGNDD